jgi:hypothetical protein
MACESKTRELARPRREALESNRIEHDRRQRELSLALIDRYSR